MKKNELRMVNGIIYRILYYDEPRCLIIDCFKKSMPYWSIEEFFIGSRIITEEELLEATGIEIVASKDATQLELTQAQCIWNSICNIVCFINDDKKRHAIFNDCCESFNISRNTLKARLCDYLIYQTINVFIPTRKKGKELSENEKNFRWALNKYYYNGLKLALVESYRRMIKDKYCSEDGIIKNDAPTFRQFQYFFKKYNSVEKEVISRNGKGDYMRNHRVLLGEGVREFCPAIGYGMMDSTICDIFLVNDKGELLGRPVMTACVDGYSSMCLGYSLGWEGGINSLKLLVNNMISNKVEHCKKFGIEINDNDWNIKSLPFKMITDRGREYIGDTFSQLTDLGVEMINLPPYRPELKGIVEKFFDIIQDYFRKELASKGVIFEDFQERGGVDYRKKACLTLNDFEKIILMCIVHYNTKKMIDLPYDRLDVKPFANELWNRCLEDYKNNLIGVDENMLRMTLLPRTVGSFKRNGLIVNGLRYKNYDYKDRFLEGGNATVAFDPTNVGKVWLLENGNYIEFELIESFFSDMDLESVSRCKNDKILVEKTYERESLQGLVDLSRNIEMVANSVNHINVNMKNVRIHRDNEIKKGSGQ